MSEIIRYDNYCHISQEEDLKLFKQLSTELSYKIEGAQYSPAYKAKRWDGLNHLLSSSGKFPPGLYEKVIEFYKQKGIVPDVIDQRPPNTPSNPIDIYEALKSIDKIPRYYQVEAVEAALASTRCIIRLPTGAGKTLCMALLTAKLGKKTVVYVIGKDLLYQTYKLFKSVFGEDCVGIIGDGLCEIKDINIVTIWSIGSALGKPEKSDEDEGEEQDIDLSKKDLIMNMLKNSSVHLIDECQMTPCSTIQLIAKHIRQEHIVGFSASPYRDDNAALLIEAVVGNVAYYKSAASLISEGFLVPVDIRFYNLPRYPKKKEQYQTVYSDYVVSNEQRNKLIIKANRALIEQGFRPLTLFKTIKHGHILKDMAKDLKIGILSGVDSSKKRQKITDDFLSRKIDGIFASTIFDQGVDIPELSGLVLASAGKSSGRTMQRIGRILRLATGKTRAVAVDFIDQAPYLYSHSQRRRQILSTEFNVKWPA
jgi:superfamily II DNA or RNA helicase